jgi:hypothetical protein
MQRYHRTAGTDRRIQYGVGLSAKLKSDEKTEGLAPPLDVINVELRAAQRARRAHEDELIKRRQNLSSVERRTDAVIRSFACALILLDGGRLKGPTTVEIVTGALPKRPNARDKVRGLVRLRQRLQHATSDGVGQIRGLWSDKLRAAMVALTGAIDAAERSDEAVQSAREAESNLRGRHAVIIDGIMGKVRSIFAGDKARQEWFFPDLRPKRKRAAPAAEPGEEATRGGDRVNIVILSTPEEPPLDQPA